MDIIIRDTFKMSLNNIIIEQINENYYRGEFLGLDLVIDKTTGYFNATKLCNDGNREFKTWHRTKKTKELLKSVSKIYYGADLHRNGLYEVKIGKKSISTKDISGTYVCKELILDISSWISPDFYLKCNKIILTHAEEEFKKQHKAEIKEKDCKIDELCKIIKDAEIKREKEREEDKIKHKQELKDLRDELIEKHEALMEINEEQREKLDEIHEDLNEVTSKLDRALPDRNIDPEDDGLKHNYILFKNKQKNNEYMFVRGQDKYIESLKKRHVNSFDVIIEKTKNPNPIDLTNRLKDRIKIINEETYAIVTKDVRRSMEYIKGTPTQKRIMVTNAKKEHSRIVYRLNKITLKSYDENEFLKLVGELDDDRYNI